MNPLVGCQSSLVDRDPFGEVLNLLYIKISVNGLCNFVKNRARAFSVFLFPSSKKSLFVSQGMQALPEEHSVG